MTQTLQVKEVQAKRELRFFENRHKGAVAKEKAAIKAEIKDNIELLAPAAAVDREKTLTAIADKAKQVRAWLRVCCAGGGGGVILHRSRYAVGWPVRWRHLFSGQEKHKAFVGVGLVPLLKRDPIIISSTDGRRFCVT